MSVRRWRFGNNAGGAFLPNGDLWVAHWVTTPGGASKILVTTVGFRDLPEGRRKVIVGRKIVDPPKCEPLGKGGLRDG
jgi:hypothetical protein